MNITAVVSTTLMTIAYDDAQKLLQVEFRSRAVYQYFGVPATVHEALLVAPSKGAYFNQCVRGQFSFVRVSGVPMEAPKTPAPSGRRPGGAPWRAQ